MREIKFRGKRKDNSQWIIGYLLKDEITGQCFIFALGNSVNESENFGEDGCLRFFAFEVEEDTICQYTGLKDKNNNEICNGDICRIDGGFGNRGVTCKVAFNDGCFDVVGELFRDYLKVYVANHSIKVIGNIYDNPDLLEEPHEN